MFNNFLTQEYDFVHVTAKTRNGELDVSCSCVLYGVVRHTLSSNGVNEDSLREVGCCHTRILTEAILGPTDLKDFIHFETIEKAKGFLDHPIVLLPSKTNVCRYISCYSNNIPSNFKYVFILYLDESPNISV